MPLSDTCEQNGDHLDAFSSVAGVTLAEFQPVQTPKLRRGQCSPAYTARLFESFKDPIPDFHPNRNLAGSY